jgi:thiamine-phosphate pyrophosphorylase
MGVLLPRFYPILDTALLDRKACPAELAAQAVLEGGARILQLRHKGHFDRTTFSVAGRIAEMCAAHDALLVINDRADIALVLHAAVHLGQHDLAPSDARSVIGAKGVVGFSTHNEAQLRAAVDEPIDYLALGPIFATGSKQNPDPVVGVGELRRLRPLTRHPFVAIGGIVLENAPAILNAGADSVAVIRDLIPEQCNFQSIRRRTEEWIKVLHA